MAARSGGRNLWLDQSTTRAFCAMHSDCAATAVIETAVHAGLALKRGWRLQLRRLIVWQNFLCRSEDTMRHVERHRTTRIGWLRAAVLGANDGIVSTASLMVGVTAASASQSNILLVGVAGLVATNWAFRRP